MKKNKYIIAANWKMNPGTIEEARALMQSYRRLAKRFEHIDYRVCVPSVFIYPCASVEGGVSVYAQNMYHEDAGSYTGAISLSMIESVGAGGVLIGHSERRNLFGVNDEIVERKITKALEHDTPMIVCFGEESRDESGEYTDVLKKQLVHILEPFVSSRKIKLLTLAYEPVWAIGDGADRAVTQDELFSTAILIRNTLVQVLGEGRGSKVPVLYGGSVNEHNAQALAATPNIQGFLIGRASLDKDSIKEISETI